MAAALVTLFALVGLGALIVAGAIRLTLGLFPAQEPKALARWLVPWGVRGLGVPCIFWALMNVGISWSVPAYMPNIQAAQYAGRPWAAPYLAALAGGWFVAGSCWAAATLAWGLVEMYRGLKEKKNFHGLCLTAGLGMLLIAAGVIALGGWLSLGLAACLVLAPIAGYAPGLVFKKPHPPMYSKVIAKLKFGKYNEAEWEIIKQLEECEDDFECWMMLATLYAEHFSDLPGAEQTVLELCDHPGVTSSQMAVALHRLADWHLKLKEDPEGARRSLQMICDRLPRTHLAHMASIRLNQLPASKKEVQEQRIPKVIRLPALGDTFEEGSAGPPMERATALRLAHEWVERLRKSPDNVELRERFARLLAEQLGEAGKAIEQLELLLKLPDQSRTRQAEWLSLIAAFRLKQLKDPVAGKEVLQRIVSEFPETPQALAARRRLQLLGQSRA